MEYYSRNSSVECTRIGKGANGKSVNIFASKFLDFLRFLNCSNAKTSSQNCSKLLIIVRRRKQSLHSPTKCYYYSIGFRHANIVLLLYVVRCRGPTENTHKHVQSGSTECARANSYCTRRLLQIDKTPVYLLNKKRILETHTVCTAIPQSKK